MIGEVAVWLMVIATDPDSGNQYTVDDTEIKQTEECYTPECLSNKCVDAQHVWIEKALKVTRGTWILNAACQIEHVEGRPAASFFFEEKPISTLGHRRKSLRHNIPPKR